MARKHPKAPRSEGTLDRLPPECVGASASVAQTRTIHAHFAAQGGVEAEDVIGCCMMGVLTFGGEYLPKGRPASSAEEAVALVAVFRDYLRYGSDLLRAAGWSPSVLVASPERIAFERFTAWRRNYFRPSLESTADLASARGRVRTVMAVWQRVIVAGAERAGRLNLKLARGDVKRTLQEAGLRGEYGADSVSPADLHSEAELIRLEAEATDSRLIYRDDRGRMRLSWRVAKSIHPNRGQRMPTKRDRKRIRRILRPRSVVPDPHDNQDRSVLCALDEAWIARGAREAQRARDTASAASLDRRVAVDRLRGLARARGLAAVAALSYLLPRIAGIGSRLTRNEARMTVSPPVTPDAMRHQEVWLRPRVKELRALE